MANVDISDRLILVAGMHRSGTSALARILNLMGAHVPEPVVPAFDGNEHGHWEPEDVVHMNDRFLADAGVYVNTSVPVDPAWFQSVAAGRAADEIARYLGPWLQSHERVVVKDPRIALLAPVWRRAVERIGVTPRFVLPFRRPQEVAASLTRRQLRFFPDEVWPRQRGVMIWLTHVVELERATRGALRSFIGFDELLLAWRPGVERVLRQIDLPPDIPDSALHDIEASIRGDSRREFARDEDDAPPLVVRVLAALHACAADPGAAPGAFDVAAAELDAMRRLLGGYLRELETKAERCGELQTEAERSAAGWESARKDVRRLELRAAAAELAASDRNAERTRLASLTTASDGGSLSGLQGAHALAEARDRAERLERRGAAALAVLQGRADDARRARARHSARLATEAALRTQAEGEAGRERLRTEALAAELGQERARNVALMHDREAEQQALREIGERLEEAVRDRDRSEEHLVRARTYAEAAASEKVAAAAGLRDALAEAEAAAGEAHRARRHAAAETELRARAEARVVALAAEAADLRRTLSWRVTAPMRRLRARLR